MLRHALWSVLVLLSCSAPAECVPGRQVACACLGGYVGTQICARDGLAYGNCTCPMGEGGGSGGGAGGGGFGGSSGFGGFAGGGRSGGMGGAGG